MDIDFIGINLPEIHNLNFMEKKIPQASLFKKVLFK